MKLKRLRFLGVTCFDAEVDVDFGALGDGLIALVGENGAGKSSVMECVAAALYKTFPTRPGSLYNHCHGTDAFISATFETERGSVVEARLLINCEASTTESYLLENGEPVVDSRAAAYADGVEDLFGSRGLFLASVFAAQSKVGSFLDMPRGDRKALFVELLALGALDELAAEARRQLANAEINLGIKRDKLDALEVETSVLPRLGTEYAEAGRELEEAQSLLSRARATEASAAAECEAARVAAGQLGACSAALDAATREVASCEAACEQVSRAESAARKHVSEQFGLLDPESVRQQFARVCDQQIAATTRRWDALSRHRATLEALPTDYAAVRSALAEAEAAQQIELDRQKRRADLESAHRAAQTELAHAERRRDMAQAHTREQLHDAKQRAALIDSVPCSGMQALSTSCALLANAHAARQKADELSRVTHEVEVAAVREAQDKVEGYERAIAGLLPVVAADWASTIAGLRADLDKERIGAEAMQRIAELETEQALADEQYTAARVAADERLAEIASKRSAIETTLGETLQQLDHERGLHKASLTESLERKHAAQTRYTEALQASGLLAKAEEVLRDARELTKQLQDRVSERDGARQFLELELRRLGTVFAKAEKMREEVASSADDVSDWGIVSKGVGKDGMQALEVDAAGPEVAALTNDLLLAWEPPRFQISLETLRVRRDGGTAEAFEIIVYDGADKRPVEALSGGERVIVSEALSLALAIYNARKSGIRWRTLFRDETAGALDPENAGRYVAMLRRALTLGNFSQCVFVAHLPQVYEAADVQLLVGHGRVTVGRAL